MRYFAFASLAFVLAILLPLDGRAQTPASDPFGQTLRAPKQVVLFVDGSLRYRDFVDPLACMLQNALNVPVVTKVSSLPLTPNLRANADQYAVEQLIPAFYQSIASKEPQGTFSFLLLSDDLKSEPFHYVFSTAEGDATTSFHAGVLSIARLDPGDLVGSAKERSDTTSLRAYKLLLKAVARLSGYGTEQGCILAFPRSLIELDEKSAEFCPADRGVLVAGGILRPTAGKGCNIIADADDRRRT